MGSLIGSAHRVAIAILALVLPALAPLGAAAEDLRFFQIGTGPTGESRFPMGGVIANALSNPPGSRECDRGGSCGVPGLVAVAKSTAGSQDNLQALTAHRLDAALVDAYDAYQAVHGSGRYRGKPAGGLRGIAMIYPESLHVVVRQGSAIRGVGDLRGKRVSLGAKGSTTLAQSRLLLAAWGLSERQVKPAMLDTATAAAALAAGTIDAFIALDGWPISAVADLARTTPIRLVPLSGPPADKLRTEHPFLTAGAIGANAYDGVTDPVTTLEVGVALVTSADEDEALINGVTRALWHPNTQRLLTEGNLHGRLIRLDSDALTRLGIEPHPGAAAYYASARVGQ